MARASCDPSLLGQMDDFQPLIALLCRDPRDAGATEMLAAVETARSAKLSPAAMADALRDVADRYPHNPALAEQAVSTLVAAGRNEVAVELARRCADANPNGADPRRVLAGLYMNGGDWINARQAVLLWLRPRRIKRRWPISTWPKLIFSSPIKTPPTRYAFCRRRCQVIRRRKTPTRSRFTPGH